jgi:tRNA1Val (adenine37-N6)-methyltransferase
MPNNYFQFKKYRVEQCQDTMKVTTEACVLGAWVASRNHRPQRILDVGTGTGLLALMLAQVYRCEIDAVEIEEEAACKAASNFAKSPWSDRLHLISHDIRTYHSITTHKYDLIISNPPFFANHQMSGSQSRDRAIHQEALSQLELINATSSLLTEEGCLEVMYPIYEGEQFIDLASNDGFYVHHQLKIKDSEDKSPFRMLLRLSKQPIEEKVNQTLIIKATDGTYSQDFIKLLKPYYLYL